MRIASLTLQNFRCFGPVAATITLSDLTVLIGTNGCGKTAALLALSRLFGMSQAERRLTRSDFHLPCDELPENVDDASLLIEARIEFPELANGDGLPPALECFNQMVIAEPDADPFCRVRLEGTWKRSSLPEGDIEESISWITTAGDEVSEDHRKPMSSSDRSRIHVLYVPASRDPARQTRQVSGAALHRLLRAVEWSQESRQEIEDASEEMQESFSGETGVELVQHALTETWGDLQETRGLTEVALRPVGRRLDDVLRQIEVVFRPSEDSIEQPLDRLSDGLKSLFYFALIAAEFDVVEKVRARDEAAAAAFSADELRLPALTLFAMEEAENHLAPHYLGRIVGLLQRMANSPTGQVLLTSQSPAILSRVDPEQVRYLRLGSHDQATIVKSILLPDDDAGEVYKYVKEAVRAFPELYFASVVVLCEGDSEEIVLPRIAKARDLTLETSFVSVVPLGGRHVNHFWRLLNDLSIPFVTLLDLDRERDGGGWGRIKYACDQLLEIGRMREEVLKIDDGVLSDEELAEMHTWSVSDTDLLNEWAVSLEEFDVFFSAPLDLDWAMLRAFPDAYHAATSGTGPRPLPAVGTQERTKRLEAARLSTLKAEGTDGSTYTEAERAEFVWYSYLFLSRGKPATHILALNALAPEQLRDHAPPVFHRLLDRVQTKLQRTEEIELF